MAIKRENAAIYRKINELKEEIIKLKKLYFKNELFLKNMNHKFNIHKKTIGLHNTDKEE